MSALHALFLGNGGGCQKLEFDNSNPVYVVDGYFSNAYMVINSDGTIDYSSGSGSGITGPNVYTATERVGAGSCFECRANITGWTDGSPFYVNGVLVTATGYTPWFALDSGGGILTDFQTNPNELSGVLYIRNKVTLEEISVAFTLGMHL
jgi:hypothetical protein